MTSQVKVKNDSAEITKFQSAEKIFGNDLVEKWLKFAAVSEKSMTTYKGALKQLFLYFADKGIATPARADIENFRDSLIDAGKSASTVALYMTSCKLFFRWLSMEGIFPNIADHIKNRVKISTNHKKDSISIEQANNLLKSVEGEKEKALRDRAIIGLLLTCGLRSIEICRADICDIRQINGRNYLYVQGKGRSEKNECVEVPAKVMKLIDKYLKAREKAAGKKLTRNAPLFVSTARRNKGCRITGDTIRRMVKEKLRRIGIDTPTVSCHSLRHFAACTMVAENVELPNIQAALRHKNLATTMIYLNYFNRLNNRAECAVAKVLRI